MRISDWSSDVCSSDLPGASLLPVDEKGAVGDCFGPKEAIFAAFLEQMGEGTQQPVAVNAAVDDEMRDMDALRADLASETLRQGAHAGLGARKSTEQRLRSEEHTSELQSLMRISYAVFCLKKKNNHKKKNHHIKQSHI